MLKRVGSGAALIIFAYGFFHACNIIWPAPIFAQTNIPNTLPAPKIHGVKITSPTKFQQVPVGSNLLISGTSKANSTSSCKVSVIVDGIRPYQQAVPTSGPNDYSKWSFTLASKYTTIKQGENKITAKYFCKDNPKLVSFYSVNVTGVGSAIVSAPPSMQQRQHQAIAATGNNATPTVLHQASPTSKTLSISTDITRNPIIPGDKQNITISLHDALSNVKVVGAKLDGKVSSANGLTSKEFKNSTGVDGQVSYSWIIEKNAKPGLFIVRLNASAAGYDPKSATTAFEVYPNGGSSTVQHPGGAGTSKDHHGHSSSSDSVTRAPIP